MLSALSHISTIFHALTQPIIRAADLSKDATLAATAEQVQQNFPLAFLLSSIAGASTGLGGLLIVLQSNLTSKNLGLTQGAAAGFMLSVSFFDLLPTVLEDLSLKTTIFYTLLGAILFLLLKWLIPESSFDNFHPLTTNPTPKDYSMQQVLFSGFLTATSICIHNFPEGAAVCIASLRGIRFGLPLALAIGLHNLPEGFSVALPVYYATRDKWYAVKLAFLSGMAEPAGVVFVLGLVKWRGSLTRAVVSAMLAGVAGIMITLSAVELFPQGCKHAGFWKALAATMGGLFVMTLLLVGIDKLGLGI